MTDVSVGALVPSVNNGDAPSFSEKETATSSGVAGNISNCNNINSKENAVNDLSKNGIGLEMDKDFLCPICMQIVKAAVLTSCGHTFCYMCILTHLNNKNDCPCCANYLTNNNLVPNVLLNKLLERATAHQMAKSASPIENLRLSLQQGVEVTIKELDDLLLLLVEKKRKMEQEEAETNMQILLDFLQCLRKQKIEELKEVQTDLQYIKEDVNAVERHRMEIHRAKERYSVKLRMLDDPISRLNRPGTVNMHGSIATSNARSCQDGSGYTSFHNQRGDSKFQGAYQGGLQKKSSFNGLDSHNVSQSGLAVARRRRVNAQFNDLQECYLQKRRKTCNQSIKQEEGDSNSLSRQGYHAGLEDFQSVLTTFTRYSRLRVLAELRHGDLFHSANIVSSIEFDRDDELFATAGVSRRIKVFEFSTVVNEPADVHCPVVEMSTRSKLSCLSWNKYIKNQIASSDYEGIVTVWDVNTRQSIMEYEEHEKRAWSVDFSRTEPSMLVSGSDDCKVKVWCTKQEASVLNIDMKANICCVKYNPGSSRYIAVGSADHHIHYYDIRNISAPLHIYSGHRKAVSYVKFLSNNELASASTDSTLRLWDVKENSLIRVFKGHTNEKNFVGLSVSKDYIACGSEVNEVFVYHKAISKPAAWHRFGSSDADDADADAASYFISAVCWKSDSPTMLAANSQGTIKVLVLAP